MAKIDRNCKFCDARFKAEIKKVNIGYGLFCSRSCSSRAKGIIFKERADKKKVLVKCSTCSSDLLRKKSDLKRSKSGHYFCNRECKGKAQHIGGIKEILPPHYGRGEKHYRSKAFRAYANECNRCGYSKCRGALEVHHGDRNRENNDVDNLEILCRNCHAEEHYMK